MLEKEQGDIPKARQLFEKASQVDPKDALTWQAWAVMESKQNNIGEIKTEYSARWLFNKASQVDPQNVHVWQAWAVMEKEIKQWSQAERYFLRAANNAKNPKDRGRIYFDLAIMFIRIDQHKSEGFLIKALEANPKDSIIHARLAKLYGFQNRWEESEKHFKNALELKPNDQITKKWYENMQRAKERYQTRKK